MAWAAGPPRAVAPTRAAWKHCVTVPRGVAWQDEAGWATEERPALRPGGAARRPARPAAKAPAAGVFAELRDGAVIFGGPSPGQPKMPHFGRRPQVLKERDHLAGLWGSHYRRMAHAPRGGNAAVWDEDGRRWQPVSNCPAGDSPRCRGSG
jgi:hypothetical protein